MGNIPGLNALKVPELNRLDTEAIYRVERIIQSQRDLVEHLTAELKDANRYSAPEQRRQVEKSLQRALAEERKAIRMQNILIQKIRTRKQKIYKVKKEQRIQRKREANN